MKRIKRIAIVTGSIMAVPTLAFAAWIVSATISSVNITGTAASMTVTGQSCTKVAQTNYRPTDTLANCTFKTSGNLGTALNTPSKFTATATGTNVTTGTVTYDSGSDTLNVPVSVSTAGTDPSISTVTLTFNG